MLPVSGRFHGIIVFQMILKCGKSFVIVEDWALSWCHFILVFWILKGNYRDVNNV